MADQPLNTDNPTPGGPYEGMEIPDLSRVLEQQRQFNISGSENRAIMEEMRDYMKQIADYQNMSVGKQSRINKLTSNATKLASELASFNKDNIKNATARQKFIDKYNEALDFQTLLEIEINELLGEDTEKREELAKILGDILGTSREVSSEAGKLSRELERVNRTQEKFESFEKIIKDIPVVRQLFSQLTKGSKAFSDSFAKTGSIGQARLAGTVATTKGFLEVTFGALVTGLIRGLTRTNESVATLQNNLALSSDAASKLSSTLQSIKGGVFTLDEVEKAAIGFNTALGSASIAAGSTYKRVTLLAERLGVSADESARIYSLSTDTNTSFERQTDILAGSVEMLNNQTGAGIRLTDVLKDIAGASADTAITFSKFPDRLAKAAYESRRLGLNLKEIKGVQESLLDFSSSITAEMNAEALLGKELNLDRARYFAFTNDIASLSKELYDLTGGLAEFEKMSAIDRKAYAAVFGMTSDQMADMFIKREALLKLAKDEQIANFDTLSQEEQIAALIDKYTKKDLNLSVEDARIKALEALKLTEQAQGAKVFNQQEKALGAMKELKIAFENIGLDLAEAFKAITGLDDPLKTLATKVTELNATISNWLKNIDPSEPAVKKRELIFKGGATLGNLAQTAVKGAEKAAEAGTKTGFFGKIASKIGVKALGTLGKGLGKAIPGLGLILSLVDFLQGDTTGGIINLIAGIASFFPGIGTGFAAALGAYDIGREGYNLYTTPKADQDKTKQAGETDQNTPTTANPKDFIIKTYPEDAIKFTGGTLLGDSVKESVDDMIKSVNPIDENGLSKALQAVTLNTKAPVEQQTPQQQPIIQTVDNTETNKLLQILVDTVKKGGNIYLDRRKVGESLVLGYSSQ